MQLRVKFEVEVPIEIKKRKKWFLASCHVLDVHSQGETEAKARKNLVEALQLFITSCFERGTLDAVLKQCGFVPAPIKTEKKAPRLQKEDYLNIPIPFLIQSHKGKFGCHA